MDSSAIPLSALQHWLFCPRQCALIHVECLWEENRFTAEGRLLHEKADKPGRSRRDGIETLRALPISSRSLGLTGKADIVELHDGKPCPVEYKRGRPKAHRADEVQLCAQAICLEEMFETPVEEGALFYGKTRRRKTITFDNELRRLTRKTARQAGEAIRAGRVPAPVHDRKHCDSCSLAGVCKPRQLANPPSIAKWLQQQVDHDREKKS